MKKIVCLIGVLLLFGCSNMEPQKGFVCEMTDNSDRYSQVIDFDYNEQKEVISILFQTVLPASEVSKDKLEEAQEKANQKYDAIKGTKAFIHYDDSEESVFLESQINMLEYNIKKDELHLFRKEMKNEEGTTIYYEALKKHLETENVFKCIKK